MTLYLSTEGETVTHPAYLWLFITVCLTKKPGKDQKIKQDDTKINLQYWKSK